jgi:hypothetical protein
MLQVKCFALFGVNDEIVRSIGFVILLICSSQGWASAPGIDGLEIPSKICFESIMHLLRGRTS